MPQKLHRHVLELKVPPPVVAFLSAVLMWLISRALPSWSFVFPARNLFVLTVAIAGAVTAGLGLRSFVRARTTVNPTKPDSSSSLVVSGVYAFTRNPMYLGLLLLLTAWAIFLSNVAVFLLLPVFIYYMNRFQIVPEEEALASLFGRDFVAYKSRVRRWL